MVRKSTNSQIYSKRSYYLRSSAGIQAERLTGDALEENDLTFNRLYSRQYNCNNSEDNPMQSRQYNCNNSEDNPMQSLHASSSSVAHNNDEINNQNAVQQIQENRENMRTFKPLIKDMNANQANDLEVANPIESPQYNLSVPKSFSVNEFVITRITSLRAWQKFREEFRGPAIILIPFFIVLRTLKWIICTPYRIYRYFIDSPECFHITNMRASCEIDGKQEGLFMNVTLYHPVKKSADFLWWLIPLLLGIAALAWMSKNPLGLMPSGGDVDSDQYKQIAGLLRDHQEKFNDLSHKMSSDDSGIIRALEARQNELSSQIEQLRKSLLTVGSGSGGVDNVALQALVDRIESSEKKMERSISELRNEMQSDGGSAGNRYGGDGGGWFSSGDDSSVVNKALEIYSADKIGMADYALESSGGSVVGTRCTYNFDSNAATMSIFGIPIFRLYRSARTIIQANTLPGECWAFKGHHARVVIKLATTIYVKAVTVDHIIKQITLFNKIDSAPRDFAVKGLKSEYDYSGVVMGNFTYSDVGPAIQTFKIGEDWCPSSVCRPYNLVEFEVLNNYGNPHFTCVYRFRVHGIPADG